ncbi:high mobility group box domain-containing protein, partial [Parasitella parasitica]
RPLNSFMIFRMEHQANVGMEYPGATHQEISKKLSKKWKELDPEEKKMYTDKA